MIAMKTFLTPFLSLLFIGNYYFSQEPDRYQITGTIKNLPAKMVYLRVMKNDSIDHHAYWPKVDSAKVSDGRFILNKDSSITVPTNSTLSYIDTITKKSISLKFFNKVSGKKHENFVIENSLIKISGDTKNNEGLLISGSKETDFVNKYGRIYFTFITIQIDDKIDSLKKTNNSVALNASLKEREQIISKFKTDFKQMIKDNSSTHGVVKILEMNFNAFNAQELDELIALLDPKLLNTSAGKNLISLKGIKETIK